MQSYKLHAALVTACLFTLPACKTQTKPDGTGNSSGAIIPTPIPRGYDFPGERAVIQEWADSWKTEQITAKAWNLWGGLSAGSGQMAGGAELPVWETWCGQEDVFQTKTCGTLLRPSRPFRNAVQLTHFSGAPKTSDTRLASFNKFNPSMAAYLATPHQGPLGKLYDYTQQSSLAELNQSWPANTPTAQRKVQEAPYIPPSAGKDATAAMELKPVMFLVKQSGLTPVPLWQGIADAKMVPGTSDCSSGPNANCHPNPTLWLTCVLVDPSATGGPDTPLQKATPEQVTQAQQTSFACNPKQYLYAPLSTLYSFQLNAEEALDFASVQNTGGMTASANDYAVLTAMHVSTKEIVNWTWQTFWWQPGADAPGKFPGSKDGMTDKVTGAWRNYAMCTAYNQTQGKDSKDMVVCFNPYLETSNNIPDGVQSNCMSCHGTATVGSDADPQNGINSVSYPADYTAPIDFDNDPRFKGFTRVDFAWSIQGDSLPPKTSTP